MARQVGTGQFDPVIGEVTNVIHGLVSRSEFTVPIVICLTEFVRDISDRVRFFRGGGPKSRKRWPNCPKTCIWDQHTNASQRSMKPCNGAEGESHVPSSGSLDSRSSAFCHETS